MPIGHPNTMPSSIGKHDDWPMIAANIFIVGCKILNIDGDICQVDRSIANWQSAKLWNKIKQNKKHHNYWLNAHKSDLVHLEFEHAAVVAASYRPPTTPDLISKQCVYNVDERSIPFLFRGGLVRRRDRWNVKLLSLEF